MLRNKAGQMAMVTPWEHADPDIGAHAGTVVTCVSFGPSGLGGASWKTEPELIDGFGNAVGWDDMDLLPLSGEPVTEGHEHAALVP